MYALARTRNRRCESWFSHKASTIVGAPPPEVHSGEDENRPQKVCMVKSVHGKRNAHPSANELSRTAHDKKNTSTTNLTPKVQQLCTTCTFTDNRLEYVPLVLYAQRRVRGSSPCWLLAACLFHQHANDGACSDRRGTGEEEFTHHSLVFGHAKQQSNKTTNQQPTTIICSQKVKKLRTFQFLLFFW